MGPDKGTSEYEIQKQKVFSYFLRMDPGDKAGEDIVIAMFAMDRGMSRGAIMEGLQMFKLKQRNEQT